MSALGQKQTMQKSMSALPPKADIYRRETNRMGDRVALEFRRWQFFPTAPRAGVHSTSASKCLAQTHKNYRLSLGKMGK
jgi:hypothetical protein